ncbi:hypothetical protein [Marinoscillum sp.]|uniref:hypothetical protein n=1 Tax=Marinoscillum sp. TaxID=2024838 RepID=UPI003BAC2121
MASLHACDKGEAMPNTELVISVEDAQGNKITTAEVYVYESLAAFQNETGSVAAGLTNTAGYLQLKNLEAQQVYYLDVRKGAATNWIHQTTSATIREGMNDFSTTISENWYSNLSSVGGKVWSPKFILQSDQWIQYDDCFNDDQYQFYKNFDMDFRNNTKCIESTEDFFTGQWFGTATQLSIYTDAAEDAGLSFKLLESSPDHFVGQLRVANGQLITVYFGKTNG